MSRKDIEEEIQYQKLHGMPRYPKPQGGILRKLFAIIITILIILAIIAFAKSGLKF